MLLDGDIGLTERVPLELHVNGCRECGQRLADLQILRSMPQKLEPRSPHRRPIVPAGLVGRTLEALRPPDLVSRLHHLDVGDRLRHLDEGIRLRGLDVVTRLRGFDVVGRLRHLVVDRIPPRHLAVAAAVPLTVMMAIFVFERGFTVGVGMRQRGPAAPASMRSSPEESSPSSAFSQSATARAQRPPASPPQPVSSPSPSASSSLAPPAEKSRAATGPETRPVDARTMSALKQDRLAPAATVTPAPAKSAPVSASPASSGPPRKETPSKSGAVARAAPASPAATTAAAVAPQIRRGTVDVVGRLQVKNRSEAERDLAALVARAGGTCLNPQRGPAITVVEASVPHANYGKFAQGVVRLGSWRIEAERSPLPDVVQVTVRLAD